MNRSNEPLSRLARGLWQWLLTGLALLAVFPAARGHAEWVGWLPFWLCLAPASALLALHRRHLIAMLSRSTTGTAASHPPPRRRRGQARRLASPASPRRSRLRAA